MSVARKPRSRKQPIKARIMWAAELPYAIERKMKLQPQSSIAVIDVSDPDALILQADEAILHCGDWSFQNTPLPMEMARAVLESLGIIKRKAISPHLRGHKKK